MNKVIHVKNTHDGQAQAAVRTHVSTFHGRAFSSERDADTDELRIYHTAVDPLPTSTFGDKTRTTDRVSMAPGGTMAGLFERHAAARAAIAGCECKK